MRRLAPTTAVPLACLLACAADETSTVGQADESSDTGTSADEGPDPDDTGEAGTSGASDGSGEGSEGVVDESTGAPEPEFEPYPARGITVTEIFANQGVQVPIFRDGEWVGGSGRNAELVQFRQTLIRGLWRLEDDWEPHEIEAKLTLSYDDGSEEVATRLITPTENSSLTDFDTNAYFVIPGELIEPRVKFQLELLEVETGREDDPGPALDAYPAEPNFVGIEDRPMVLRSMIVPVRHALSPDCPEAPEMDEATMQVFEDQLYMQNPVERVELLLHEPVEYDGSLSSFNPLLGFMADLRVQDNADPDLYYYGVVRPCDGGPSGVGGQAISVPSFPEQGNAWTRTSVGRFYGSLSSTVNTYVHEVGHTQGRRHINCSGEEGGVDITYPYELGDIGVYGFGVLDFTVYTPTTGKDYMTYCGNTWVSDWGWRKVVPFIEEITSWGFGGAEYEEEGRLLVGLIEPQTGVETWFETPGTLRGRDLAVTESIEVVDGDGLTTLVEATTQEMGEHGAYNVAIPLPDAIDLSRVRSVTRFDEGSAKPVRSIRSHGRMLKLAD